MESKLLSKAFDWIDEQGPNIERDLEVLSGINSGSRNVEGLSKCRQWLQVNMGLEDAEFEDISLPGTQECDDAGEVVDYCTEAALQWTIRPNARKRLLLAIHYDTVFGKDHSFQQVCRLDKDRFQGPGVADAKGGILVIRTALMAIERFRIAPSIGWTVLLNPDEEIGSPHSTSVMNQIAPNYTFGLLFEPALPTGQLVSTRGGSGNYTIVVRGRSAHVGRHFNDGRNAIARLSEMLTQLDHLNGTLPGFILNTGFIRGGEALNVVPDLAIGKFNVRVSTAEQITWFEEQLSKRVSLVRLRDGYNVEMYGGVTSPPKPESAELGELRRRVESAFEICGQPPIDWIHTQGVCDGNKLAAAGLANIDSLGPIGGGLHSSDEWVSLSSIRDRAKVVASLFCSLQEELKTDA
jgi:glutamate carboxypeptidase